MYFGESLCVSRGCILLVFEDKITDASTVCMKVANTEEESCISFKSSKIRISISKYCFQK